MGAALSAGQSIMLAATLASLVAMCVLLTARRGSLRWGIVMLVVAAVFAVLTQFV